ncbi:MAG: zinc carboxypeptidase, partial [FCB group bacterium]|nr:zinc carboxypeptidase [FCB group bacterium]
MNFQSSKITLLLIAMLVSVWAGAAGAIGGPVYEDHSLMVVGPFSLEEYHDFLREGHDVVEILPDGTIKVVSRLSARDQLIADYGAKIEIENIEAYNRSRLDPTRDMGGYTTYGEAVVQMIILSANPLLLVDTIGYSLEGRPLWGIKISDNVEVDEDEPEVYFNSLIHAREPIGLEITLDLIHQLLDNYGIDPTITSYVDETEIWITPIVNPDGYVYNETTNPFGGGMWRKNLRDNGDGSYGVDLNRNWGFLWGLDDVGSTDDGYDETYRGTAAWSEPEALALHDFIIAHDFSVIVNYHSYGNMYVRPFGFDRSVRNADMPKYSPLLDSLYHLNYYSITPSMYPTNGGAYDWQYGEQFEKRKIFGILPEVGYWFWPDAID